jgi:hypothetical protein
VTDAERAALITSLSRPELEAVCRYLALRVTELQYQLRTRERDRQERVALRCQRVHGIIVAKGLPTATAADWQRVYEHVQAEDAAVLVKKAIPADLPADLMTAKQIQTHYVGVRALRKQYGRWLALLNG